MRASGSRCVHKAGKYPPLRKQQRRQRQQQQQFYINASENEVHLYKERNPSREQNLDCNFSIDMQKTLRWCSYLQVRVVLHHDECEREVYTLTWREEAREMHLENVILLQYWGEDSKINWRRIHEWGLTALPLPWKMIFLEICKNEAGELSENRAIRRHSAEIIIPSRLVNYVLFHHKGWWHTQKKGVTQRMEVDTPYIYIEGGFSHTLLTYVDQARDQYSIAKAGLVAEEERKKGNQTILFTNSDADSRGRWIIKFIEDLNKMQSTEFYCPRRKNEFWQTASTPSLCTSLCWKNASQKLSKKETRVVRKTTYVSKGPEVTLRHFTRSLGRRDQIADVELRPNSIRESQLAARGTTGTNQYMQTQTH